ncbi:MAG: 30S ribosomal protein S4 [Christensenellaceae bacterium]|nr:30S ribosomal protein S4 [Christensenellaceae bacterium]MBR3843512.1 30S ribosomal protein S4 [Christensenellaceae bacterium]
MARYTGPVCRLCRREGTKLFLKGDRCYSANCAFVKRQSAPGQHGARRKKLSEYGLQLREKQKVKRAYGMLEGQFRSYFTAASKVRGATGATLLILCERRLDNTVYRLGIGASRAQARQIVMHGHITVNGKKVDIPSFRVSVGDVIEVKAKSAKSPLMKAVAESDPKPVPKWLTFEPEQLKGTVVALPERDDIDLTIEEHNIVELYSK